LLVHLFDLHIISKLKEKTMTTKNKEFNPSEKMIEKENELRNKIAEYFSDCLIDSKDIGIIRAVVFLITSTIVLVSEFETENSIKNLMNIITDETLNNYKNKKKRETN